MPIFQIQTKEGKAFEIEAPNYDSALQSLGGGTANADAGGGGGGGVMQDIAQSAPSKLGQGMAAVPGMVTGTKNLMERGSTWMLDKAFGVSPQQREQMNAKLDQNYTDPTQHLSSQNIYNTARKAIGAEHHEPQT